jgi:hypothetical protein
LAPRSRAAPYHRTSRAELNKKAWCSSAKQWQVLAEHDLICS